MRWEEDPKTKELQRGFAALTHVNKTIGKERDIAMFDRDAALALFNGCLAGADVLRAERDALLVRVKELEDGNRQTVPAEHAVGAGEIVAEGTGEDQVEEGGPVGGDAGDPPATDDKGWPEESWDK